MVVQFIPILILQWNARSLLSNGQDFKQFIYNQTEKPGIICIQETWLKPFFGLYLDILQSDVIGKKGMEVGVFH